jgi:predicted nucleic acid-binding protein
VIRIVADASIIGNILLEDEQGDHMDSLLEFVSTADLVEPAHWPIESCGLLLKAARRRRLSATHRDTALGQAQGLIALAEIETGNRLGAVIDLARQHHISIYDAAYLELAIRMELPLLTSDKGLRSASVKAHIQLVSIT